MFLGSCCMGGSTGGSTGGSFGLCSMIFNSEAESDSNFDMISVY